MNTLIAFFNEILSNAVIAVLLFLCSKLFELYLIPLFSNCVYRGVRIDGTWEFAAKSSVPDEYAFIRLEIKQSADKITGKYKHGKILGAKDTTDSFELNGAIRDGYVSALITPENDMCVESGAFILRVFQCDGMRLKGAFMNAKSLDGTVAGFSDIEFLRKKD